MPPREPPIYAPSNGGALRQGEIVSNLIVWKLRVESVMNDPSPVLDQEVHPFVIVITQDCDLDQDFKLREKAASGPPLPLPSVLFAEMNAAVDAKATIGASDIWKRVKGNKDERYQFLEAARPDVDAAGQGLPELVIDFKRYFTLPTSEAYLRVTTTAQRRCRLVNPYLEQLSTRFCYYQFRVALPLDHESTP